MNNDKNRINNEKDYCENLSSPLAPSKEERETNIVEIINKLTLRLDALRDGTPETSRLIDTIWGALERYVFITAYITANKDCKDFPKLLSELAEGEDNWSEDTDPDVLTLFNTFLKEEMYYRCQREDSVQDTEKVPLSCECPFCGENRMDYIAAPDDDGFCFCHRCGRYYNVE